MGSTPITPKQDRKTTTKKSEKSGDETNITFEVKDTTTGIIEFL
jgi:hypothetical protein